MEEYDAESIEEEKRVGYVAGSVTTLYENEAIRRSRDASDAAFEGMGQLLKKRQQLKHVGVDQGKGNIFEYIEATAQNLDAARKGSGLKHYVTDAKTEWGGKFQDPHAADDIRVLNAQGQVAARQQLKVHNSPEQYTDLAQEKYRGMVRLIPKGELDNAKLAIKKHYENGMITRTQYMDTVNHLKEGSVTAQELEKIYGNTEQYARASEWKQTQQEIIATSQSMAVANGLTTAMMVSVSETVKLLQNKTTLKKAVANVSKSTAKGTVRGGAVGALASVIRGFGSKNKIPVLSNAVSANVMSNAFLDCGISMYRFLNGSISQKELEQSLENTAVNYVTTVLMNKAMASVFAGPVPMIVPFVTYTVMSYITSSCRMIIKNAYMNIEAYRAVTAIYESMSAELYRQQCELESLCNQRLQHFDQSFKELMAAFQNGLETEEDIDTAILAVVGCSEKLGIELEHADFREFCEFMESDETFYLS